MTGTLHDLDRIMQSQVPALMVPRYGDLAPLATNGHRFLVAEDGLWLELRRAWMHVRLNVAPTAVRLPYGPLRDEPEGFAFEEATINRFVATFLADARRAAPDECAAWGVWDETVRALLYRPCVAIYAGPGGIRFRRPKLAPHEHLALDIHSHGRLGACFSSTDDEDDAGEVKLSIVIGHVDRAEPDVELRLCALGLFVDLADL